MCFGSATTQTNTSTPTANPQVASAASQSLSQAENLANTGYQAYSGNRVADFSPLQQSGFGQAATAVDSTNPYVGQSQDLIQQYGNAPAQSVQANTIASQMSPYMNQYVSQALAPQLEAQNQQFAGQNQNLNAQATSSGAFGDARAGIQAANLTNQQDIARQGLIGQAYTNAFNTAIGAGAQDVGNSMQAQQATGQFNEAALARGLGGANALQGLYGTQLSDLANQYGLSAQAGGAQQQQQQAQLNVPYSNYLAAQQYPFLTQQNLNSTIGASTAGLPTSTTSTVQQPNNSGYSLLGALAPALFNGGTAGFGGSAAGSALSGLFALSDERAKDDIRKVGELNDGLGVYTFKYKGSDVPQIGLVAQEVEKKYPDAVVEFQGLKHVNYDRATSLAAAMGDPDDSDFSDYKLAA